MALRTHLQKITVKSCNDYYLFTKKFLQCFQSVGPLLSVTNINKQWGAFHKQLNFHPLPDFHTKFTAVLLDAFHNYCKQAHADELHKKQECINALVTIIEASQELKNNQ